MGSWFEAGTASDLGSATELAAFFVAGMLEGEVWDLVRRKKTVRINKAATMARRELIMMAVGRIGSLVIALVWARIKECRWPTQQRGKGQERKTVNE